MLYTDVSTASLKFKMHPSELRFKTPKAWADKALENFDRFLQDHAACERKASALAMSLVARYPDKIALVDTMIKLAQEELEHFQQVFVLLRGRKLSLADDYKDEYVNALVKQIRTSKQGHFMDKLLVSGLIEARSCERFALISKALVTKDPALSKFYDELARVEARHNILFIRLAHMYLDPDEVDSRLNELLDIEADIVKSLPLTGMVH